MPEQTDPTPQLQEQLWQWALSSAGVPIHSGCESYLRNMISMGVQKMSSEQRLTEQDIALAHASIAKLIAVMKEQAVLLGHPEYLGEDTFGGARGAIAVQRGAAASFELWPFWPL